MTSGRCLETGRTCITVEATLAAMNAYLSCFGGLRAIICGLSCRPLLCHRLNKILHHMYKRLLAAADTANKCFLSKSHANYLRIGQKFVGKGHCRENDAGIK